MTQIGVVLPAQQARIRHEGTVDTPELRAAAAAGDRDAFAKLYELYRPVVYRYLMRRCGGSRALADDLTSDTFERALKSLPRDGWQEQGRDFGAWLITIAHNLLADHWKSYRVRNVVPLGEGAESVGGMLLFGETTDIESDAIDRASAARIQQWIHMALTQLTNHQRQILRLRFFEQLSVTDTAVKLGIEDGAVKAATHRALRTLARNRWVQALRPEVTRGG